MKYICLYDIDNREMRNYVLAAKTKIDYILKAIRTNSAEDIQIVSAATTKGNVYCSKRLESLGNNITLKLFPSFGRNNILMKAMDYCLIPIYLFFYLLKSAKPGETVIVYHSLKFITPVQMAKRIKRFKLIIEYEEIYSDVTGNQRKKKKEIHFGKHADGFILATKALKEALGICKVPYVICNGTYQVEAVRNQKQKDSAFIDDDNIINCVYAGTFDPRKGGCVAAVAAAEYLPSNYHLHIIGFGSENDTNAIKKLVEDTSRRSKAKVTFDGLKSGDEYIEFIQRCDIGLSTQNPSAAFNSTSFPSKILSYLANGLRVVSIRIPVVEESEIGQILYYYNKQTPEEIANAIMSVNLSTEYDSRKIIKTLDSKFSSDIADMLLNKRSL